MKNFKLVMVLIAVLGLAITSCKKDDTTPVDQTPNLDFKGGGSYISNNATVTVGEDFVIGITASSNGDSGEKLTSVKYTVTSNNVIVLEFDSVFSATSYNLDYVFRMDNPGDAVFNFTVTDKKGEKKSISLTITAELGTTPLGNAEDLYWERVGGAAGTGLSTFGLKWTSNLKMVNAQIKKDGAAKFVQLSADAWTSLVTMEDLMAAIDAGTDMETFTGINVDANGTYDVVLATSYNGEYFLMHLTSSNISVDANGTTVKIYGQSKK